MKSKLYVETSVISYLSARRSRDIITVARQEITRHWWRRRRDNFVLYTSAIVIQEAAEGDPYAADRRIAMLEALHKLEVDEAAQMLAEQLLRYGPLPAKAAVDALHIGVAATHEMAYLLTWNCKHIANAAMRNKIEDVCCNNGYKAPIMCTHEELMDG